MKFDDDPKAHKYILLVVNLKFSYNKITKFPDKPWKNSQEKISY